MTVPLSVFYGQSSLAFRGCIDKKMKWIVVFNIQPRDNVITAITIFPVRKISF